ncbi:MAG TPA: GntR family transcriptional regulator [Acidimicrobiales bacterium]|nr:GntR family transcriptional regulator [Acidimicrobiales bacterium]
MYLEVRRRVVDGSLPPATKLSLRRVAEALDVSIMPVRDAIVRLADEGLVRLDSGREAVVADVSVEMIMSSLTLLTWNEVLAAVDSAPLHSAADLKAMHAALRNAEEATAANDPLAFGRSSRRFHHLLGQHASSATRQVIDKISTGITLAGPMFAKYQTYEFPEGHRGCMSNTHHELRTILVAIESGDTGRTLDALLRHRDSMLESFNSIAGIPKRSRTRGPIASLR